jgi:phosphonate degradation associated HDIG domain protein
MMRVSQEVLALFERRGEQAYAGECVSVSEHCRQAAHFAMRDGASPALVVAALLHDIGHLLETSADDREDLSVDAQHETVGGRWLAQRFHAEVSDPVRLHVPAKRYLCAGDARYVDTLSPASLHTLRLQGGPMSAVEVLAFESERYCRDAVRLRRWDDAGKVAGMASASLRDYAGMIDQQANSKR